MYSSARPGFRERTSPALEWAFLGSGAAFHDQPARGSLRKRATSSASPARWPRPPLNTSAPVERGWSPPQDGSLTMSHNLTLAQTHAFDLARTLMVPVVLFQVDD